MANLTDALKKYSKNSSIKEIIKGLQENGYIDDLNPVTQEPIFQNYLIALLNLKTNEDLSVSLNNFKDIVKEFSFSSSKSAKILNYWTKVLAFATIVLAIVTIINFFYYLFQEQKYNKITTNSLQEEINLLKSDIIDDTESQKNYLKYIDIDKYWAAVLQIGGIGSHMIQKEAHLLSEHGYLKPAEDLVSAGFNSSGDIMDVNCRDGYLIINCKVNDRDYYLDDIFGCRALIADKMQNRVYIECIKNN